jgi:transposase
LGRRGAVGDDSRVASELDTAAQPDDAVILRALLAERDAAIAERDAAIAERDAALAERDAQLRNAGVEIEKLKIQLAALRRDHYGRSAERFAAEVGQLEMLIGDLEEDQAQGDAAAEGSGHAPNRRGRGGSERSRRPAVRRPLPEHLPRETVVHEPVPACRCGCTDPSRLTRLGEDITEVLEKTPARLKVIRHVRPRYACRACETVLQAPAPDLPVERGRPGPGLMAHVLVSKYLDGLPLYRLSGILAREGVAIERQTLADWVGRGAWWLGPIAEAIGRHALSQRVVWTDDTPIRVLAPGRGRTREGRFWVYAFDPRPWGGAGPPAAFYRYSPDRRGERPRDHLAGFAGWLQADAYAGYEALTRPKGNTPSGITHVACWAHARRKIHDVFEATRSPIAEEALGRIRALYAVEEAITGLAPGKRRAEREARSKPLLTELHSRMEAQRRRLSGKSALGKALQYALSRWDALTRYLEDGRLSIDNNLAERQLRGIAVTRRNFLFVGSDAGGERAAVIYTVAETAKLNGLDPEAYIGDVLDRLARGHPASRLGELLPWNVKAARQAAA